MTHISTFLLLAIVGLAGEPTFVENELLVRFDEDLSPEDIAITLTDFPGFASHQVSRPLNLWLVEIDLQKIQLQAALHEIETFSEVSYAQRNHFLSERLIPDDPLFEQQWNFQNTGQSGGTIDADIDAPEAWEISTGGSTVLGREIVVGVVDGGCDMDHPDLIANFWSNPGDSLGNGIDDDNNGWVDDSLGWNAFGHNGNIPTSSHGTHVAGTIGAHTNNGNQVAGVNWTVKLMTIAGASTTTSVAMEAYSYILEQKIAWLESFGVEGAFVVSTNSSFGIDFADCESGSYPVWNDMYNSLGEVGILSVAATANRNTNVDELGDVPTACSSPYVVAVTNTTRFDEKASSGYGAINIDLGAPGSSILSTNYNQSTSLKTGTSMSAPHVTGALALMHSAANSGLAQYYEDDQAEGALMFKHLLLASVDTLSSLQGITVSGGRLNLHQALVRAQNWQPPGDGNMNNDAYVNVQDVILLTQLILGNIEPSSVYLEAGDLNGDELVNVQDLIRLINHILG